MRGKGSGPTSANGARETHAAPGPPRFDAELGVWVLSRFSDVSAALHEPQLWPVGSDGAGSSDIEERTAQARNRSNVQAALTAKIAQWKQELAPVAEEIAAAIPAGRRIDVVSELASPLGLRLAARVVNIDADEAARLAPVAAKVTASTANPEDSALKAEAEAAGAELDRAFRDSTLPMTGPAFVALTQTLPCLLAKAWLVLFEYPEEMERLRGDPELLPKAVDELLRLAGLARVVHRQAISQVNVGELRIDRGQRVNLLLEVANHDPEQFAEPERLDLSRRVTGHFALGAGGHSCVAAALIRMAMGVATGVLVERFVPGEQDDPMRWRGGSGFRWPEAVYAVRRALPVRLS
jgi:cytochrome P450